MVNALKKILFLFLFQSSARGLQAEKRKSDIYFSECIPTGDFGLIHEYQIDTLLFQKHSQTPPTPRRQGSLKKSGAIAITRGQQKNFKCFGFVGFPNPTLQEVLDRFMSIKLIPCFSKKHSQTPLTPKATDSLKEVRGNCDNSGPAELQVLRFCWVPGRIQTHL
ncbi:hypothetical protein CEXT_403531 [Caerostris extrusa]|uniref:Uncharacterized protein n=1 Tax=Caerostris extrusa TaxID=172846 RepID=A0AAV4RJM1_CAEEX|nr:hypothetical protein CEXT_403531 [Caerostris extrusa]